MTKTKNSSKHSSLMVRTASTVVRGDDVDLVQSPVGKFPVSAIVVDGDCIIALVVADDDVWMTCPMPGKCLDSEDAEAVPQSNLGHETALFV